MVYIPADLDSVESSNGESDEQTAGTADADVADLRQQVGALARTLDDLLAAEGDSDRDVEGIAEAVVDDVLDRLGDDDPREMDTDLRGFY